MSRPLDRRAFRDSCAAQRLQTTQPISMDLSDASLPQLVVAQHCALVKAGVSSETVAAQLHRIKFNQMRKKHPEVMLSLQDACPPGIISALDEYALPGEGFSQLLTDASEQGWRGMVRTMLFLNANKNYRTSHGQTPLYLAAGKGHAGVAELLIAAGAPSAWSRRWTSRTPRPSTSALGRHGACPFETQKKDMLPCLWCCHHRNFAFHAVVSFN